MKNKKNISTVEVDKIDDDWSRTIYLEAWRQYCHEDNLMEQRNTKYYSIITACFSIIGVIITFAVSLFHDILSSHEDKTFILSFILLSLILLCIFTLCILRQWKKINMAGKAYLNMRFSIIEGIEKKLRLIPNIALYEKKWLKSQTSFSDGFDTTNGTILNIIVIASLLLILFIIAFVFVLVKYILYNIPNAVSYIDHFF